nr:hypothetical protein [Tanacetum cinerariifolium]
MKALIEDENAMDKGVADTVQDHKRKHDDDEDDDDEDPPAKPNQGKQTKRIRTKDSESSKKLSTTKENPKGKAPSKGSKTGKSAPAKEPVKEPIAKVVMDDVDMLNWNNSEGDRYPFDLSKPLPLTYTTLITKTKAAHYEIKGIEDMVPTLWSPIKVGYDKDALKEIKHWGEGWVKSVSVKKLHGYGHLEEIMVKRADRQFYKFIEGKGGVSAWETSTGLGLEVSSIRRIQGIGYGVLEFLGVGSTFDIFQNIYILYLEYDILSFSGYDVLDFIVLWSLVSTDMDTSYLP